MWKERLTILPKYELFDVVPFAQVHLLCTLLRLVSRRPVVVKANILNLLALQFEQGTFRSHLRRSKHSVQCC
jgi:hypothetical protein